MPEHNRAGDARQSVHRLYRGLQSYPIPVWNGLIEHRARIGEAVWEFLWCLDRITIERDGVGFVFGGAPVKLERIAADLDADKETVRRHLGKLSHGKYIRTRRTPYGQVIEVLNSRKFGVFQKPQSAVSLPREKPINEFQKPQSAVSKEDFHAVDLGEGRGGDGAPFLAFRGEHLKITIEQDRNLRSWFKDLDVGAAYVEMDRYMETHSEKPYKNFYAFARNWLKNDQGEKKQTGGNNGRPSTKPSTADLASHNFAGLGLNN